MTNHSIRKLLEEIIYKMNAICDEVRDLRVSTVSKTEYNRLQSQIEILSLQVAKNINYSKKHFLYYSKINEETNGMANSTES